MNSKTPVSILQEMCIRKGSPPQYDLIHDGGGTHEALFKYQVQVAGISAIGSGRSKKEAKHDAAKNMLAKLKDQGESAAPEPIVEEAMEVGNVISPYKDKMTENAVGALQELCNINEIKVASYDLVADEGPPHAKHFTIKCRVLKLEETAIARTKKQAKQLAAQKMLIRLKASVDELATSATDNVDGAQNKDVELNEIALGKYKELGTIPNSRSRVPVGQKISEYHLMLRSLQSPLLDKLKEEDTDVKQWASREPMNFLQGLLEELALESEIISLGSQKQGVHVILLSITTAPETVVFGMHTDEDQATVNAARNGIEHLKLMAV